MLKLLVLITLFFTLSLAEPLKEDTNLEIIAKNISMEDNIVTATNDVVVYSVKKYITANKLIYDKNKSVMELFGDVTIVEDGKATSFSEYLLLDTKKDLKVTKPSLFIEQSGKIWLNSKQVSVKNSSYQIDDSLLSSCDCVDPAWNLSFTSGDYDTDEKWVNTYNTTLFIKGVPILYTPYFGFSTDKTRRSGLLTPTIGYSSSEGVLYAQPIYYAPSSDFDLEFVPQIRWKRGYGYETKLRYADSKYSIFEANFGAFYEKENYFEEYNLTNKKHDGWNIKYNRSKLFSKNDHADGLKINLIDMNDVDYKSTQYDDNIGDYNNKVLTSKVNYYYNTNSYYGDFELKRLKDLTKESNDTTLQTLPKINLHKYVDSLFWDKLTYSVDTQYIRNTRSRGITGNTTELTIPLTYTESFFNDFIELSLGEELELINVDYQRNNNGYQDAQYTTLSHYIKAQTNLIKPYDDYLHTVNLSATYKKPETLQKSGDIYSINTTDENLELFPVTQANENFLVKLNSSLYDKDTLEQIVNYKITQLYTYNKSTNSYQKDDLAQNLRLHYGDFILSNDLEYSHDLDKIVLSSTTLDYTYKQGFANLYYQYSKDKTTLNNQEDFVYTLGFKFDNDYTLSYKEELDLTADVTKRKEFIFGIDKKCWALNLKLANNVVATDTTDNSIERQKIIYLEFHLKELFNLQQKYKSH